MRFRRDGIDATGLQPLMKALNLTYGGFYAPFKSKDELVEKALQAADVVLGPRLRQIEVALGSANADEQSLMVMSTLVGALVLARSVESEQLATRILEVVRESLKAQISEDEKAGQ